MSTNLEKSLEAERFASTASRREFGIRLARIAAITAIIAIVILSVVPGTLRPSIGASGNVEHALAYGGAAFLSALSWKHARRTVGPVAFSCLAGVAEIVQLFVPGRHAGFDNWAASTCGAVLGIALAAALVARRAAIGDPHGRITT
jgi:hypothetical protein